MNEEFQEQARRLQEVSRLCRAASRASLSLITVTASTFRCAQEYARCHGYLCPGLLELGRWSGCYDERRQFRRGTGSGSADIPWAVFSEWLRYDGHLGELLALFFFCWRHSILTLCNCAVVSICILLPTGSSDVSEPHFLSFSTIIMLPVYSDSIYKFLTRFSLNRSAFAHARTQRLI